MFAEVVRIAAAAAARKGVADVRVLAEASSRPSQSQQSSSDGGSRLVGARGKISVI